MPLYILQVITIRLVSQEELIITQQAKGILQSSRTSHGKIEKNPDQKIDKELKKQWKQGPLYGKNPLTILLFTLVFHSQPI